MKLKDYFTAKNMFFAFADINGLNEDLLNKVPFAATYYDQYISYKTQKRIIESWGKKNKKKVQEVECHSLLAGDVKINDDDIFLILMMPDKFDIISRIKYDLATRYHLPKYSIFIPLLWLDRVGDVDVTKASFKFKESGFVKSVNIETLKPSHRICKWEYTKLLESTDELVDELSNTDIKYVTERARIYRNIIHRTMGKMFKIKGNDIKVNNIDKQELSRLQFWYNSLLKDARRFKVDQQLISKVTSFYDCVIIQNYLVDEEGNIR